MAATMSSISSGVNSLTTATLVDFYQRFMKRQASVGHYLKMSRFFSLGWGLVATLLGLFVNRLGTILEISVKTNSFFTGILLGIFMLGVLTVRANWQGTSVGALVSFCVVVYVASMTAVSFLWYAPIGLALTMLLGYLFSFGFRGRDSESLAGLVLRSG